MASKALYGPHCDLLAFCCLLPLPQPCCPLCFPRGEPLHLLPLGLCICSSFQLKCSYTGCYMLCFLIFVRCQLKLDIFREAFLEYLTKNSVPTPARQILSLLPCSVYFQSSQLYGIHSRCFSWVSSYCHLLSSPD